MKGLGFKKFHWPLFGLGISAVFVWPYPDYIQLGGWGISSAANLLTIAIVLISVSLTIFCADDEGLVVTRSALALVVLLGCLFFSIMYQQPNSMWGSKLAFLSISVLFFMAWQQYQQSQREILWVIFASSILQIFLALFQLFIVLKNGMVEPYRPTGGFNQVNVFASYMSLGLISGSVLFLQSIRQVRVYAGIGVFVLASWVVISQSRTGVLVAVLSLVSLSVLVLFKGNALRFLILLIVVLLGGLFGFWILSCLSDISGVTMLRDAELMSGSSRFRLLVYGYSIALFLEQPFGVGIGNFGGSFVNHVFDHRLELGSLVSELGYFYHPHNELIMWLVEGGVIAGLGIISVATYLMTIIAKSSSYSRLTIAIALLLPFSLHSMLEFPFYMSYLHWFVYMGLLASVVPVEGVFKLKIGRPTQFMAGAILVASIIFGVTGVMTIRGINQYETQSDSSLALASIYSIPNIYVQRFKINHIYVSNRMEGAIVTSNLAEIPSLISATEDLYMHGPNAMLLDNLVRAEKLLGHVEKARRYSMIRDVVYSGNSQIVNEN